MTKKFSGWVGCVAIVWSMGFLLTPIPTVLAESAEATEATETGNPIVLDFCTPAVFDSLTAYLADGAQKDDVFQLTDEGVIEVSGTHIGYLATPESYQNFTLRGEYALQEEQTNGGLLVRIAQETPTFLPRCIEIQVMGGLAGDLFGFHDLEIQGPADRFETGKNHTMVGNYCWVHALHKAEHAEIGKWNTIEVTCYDDLVLIRINGQIVNWAYGVPKISTPIAIQSEAERIHWRHLQLIVEP